MRIGLITTLGTNIGDDFIREGIVHLLRDLFPDRDLKFIAINKHAPWTVYPSWHPLRWLPRGRVRLSRRLAPLGFSRFDGCELIVQCGAPVLWENCNACEWAGPIWRQVVGRLHHRVPVMNLAAGSCYSLENQPESVSEQDAHYLREIAGYCRLTTTRDRLANRLMTGLHLDAPFLCCTALLAARPQPVPERHDGTIYLNYMRGGGHYGWNQSIDEREWEQALKDLIRRLRPRHPLKFLCHTPQEAALAEALDPSLPRLLPRSPSEYFAAAAAARGGVFNRLHAAVGLGGMGIPSVAIGTDTRIMMVEAVGLPALYVKQASAERMEHELESLLSRREEERERLLTLTRQTWDQYLTAIGSALGKER